jgi:hypothetical protein
MFAYYKGTDKNIRIKYIMKLLGFYELQESINTLKTDNYKNKE